MDERLLSLQALATKDGVTITPIGILPTLRNGDFGLASMTDSPRYHALTEILCKSRGGPFHVRIHGVESLEIDAEDLTLEGANTSFQVHYRVTPDEFADWYNSFQLATIFTLAIGANSPIFLQKKLWHETRIPLFKQSIDSRNLCGVNWHAPACVVWQRLCSQKCAGTFQAGCQLATCVVAGNQQCAVQRRLWPKAGSAPAAPEHNLELEPRCV